MSTAPDAIDRVRSLAARQSESAVGVWSAPGRVNLIGEHTDYNDGFVLPFAIAQRTAVALIPRHDRVVSVMSSLRPERTDIALEEIRRTTFSGWSAYPLGVVWAFGEAGVDLDSLPGVTVAIDSDVPIGAGLSSSAAIECATALALKDYWELDVDLPSLAAICQRAENVAVGAPTGIMDQSVSLMASTGHALFLDCRSKETRQVPLDLSQHGLALLVLDTRVRHSHATGEYASRRASCESAALALGVPALRDASLKSLESARPALDDEAYRRARHIITENERVLQTVSILAEDSPRDIGPLLSASHASMRDDFEISCPELDLAVSAAKKAGALGARMTGGGFGGAAIALVEHGAIEAISGVVRAAFSEHGYSPPEIFTVTPHGGARAD